jgi:CubicO group peptidase (beta-lactamase class C family)
MLSSRRSFLACGLSAALGSCAVARGVTTTPSPEDEASVEGAQAADWETGRAADHGIPTSVMDGVLESGAATPGLTSMVVIRHGVLIGEHYYRGASPSDLLPVRSATKSIASLLVGQAIERGSIRSVQEPLSRLLPEALARMPDSPSANLTLEQILQGRTGLPHGIDNKAVIGSPDPVAVALGMRPVQPASSGWTYNDAVVGLLSPVLARAEGLDLAAVAARDLFRPLGIQRYAWKRDRQGRPLSYAGLALRSRDLAKIAWTAADGGVWRGRSVAPKAWVDRSTTRQGPVTWELPSIMNAGYGYLWFTGQMSGQSIVFGLGYGGQFALFARGLRLAMVTTATPPLLDDLPQQMGGIGALLSRLVAAAA